jgi:5-formyltetrahydrofolate cyclo-ligase
MKSHALKDAKRRVRRQVIERRDAIPDAERIAQVMAATDRLAALPELQTASVVMAFWSFGSEIATGPVVERLVDAGVSVALPRIAARELEPRRYRPGDPVTETPFGAMEPSDGDLVVPDAIDVVIVPAVAYDREGRRIGYGGGYYDRFLARTPAFRVGFGFDEQLVDEPLPAGAFDLGVDAIVTASQVVRCA